MRALPLPLLSLIAAALARPESQHQHVQAHNPVRRAAPDGPSGTYAPGTVDCPSQKPTVRGAGTLSQFETDWLKKRRANTFDPMMQFLGRANIQGFDAVSWLQSHADNFSAVPNVGIAVSGGGYRALMNGAGFLAAADNRTAGSTDAGGIGGLLQSATYLAGLSGGGWLVGSLFANNFTTIPELYDDGSSTWQFSNSIFSGPESDGISIVDTGEYWKDVYDAVEDKEDAGYNISITDYWGRALSYQLIGTEDGGPTYTFSSIADFDQFVDAETPMPILVADERSPDVLEISLNSTVFEFNPWEIGSWDPTLYGFVPTEYVGSNFSNGAVPDDGHCVRGFDQYGYMMGTSSSLFNSFLLQNLSSSGIPGFVIDGFNSVLSGFSDDEDDVSVWTPNPFYNFNADTNPNAGEETLTLVDGGLDLQNIPLHPLIQPHRKVDVIFAVDSSADTTNNFPNGTALRATYDRTMGDIANGTLFPKVPDAETFINLGLNHKPTFFGCDTSEFDKGSVPPLIVYMPLAPYTAYSNASTFTPSYTNDERDSYILNGYNVGTMGNGTVDPEWPACAACAVLSRSLERDGVDVPDTCAQCFTRYCWNGTSDSTDNGAYEPALILPDQASTGTGDGDSAGVRGRGEAMGLLGWAAVLAVGAMVAL